jgi:hypothetical protein
MANTSLIPKFVKKEIVDGWVGESLYLMLLSKTHVPNASTQRFISDVSANEIVDANSIYTPGGMPLSGLVQSYDPLLPNNAFLYASDLSIGPGASLNYRYGIVFKNTGNQATSVIRAQIDFLEDQIVTRGTSVIKWNDLGIIYVK